MPAFAQLDRMLRDATRTVAPAISCRIERKGDVEYAAAFGDLSPAAGGTQVSTETLFDLASVTKLFTTTACLRQCSRGTLALDTPVEHVLPRFGGVRPIGDTEDPITKLRAAASSHWQAVTPAIDAGEITIRHLLTHTSGLPAWRNVFSVCGNVPAPGASMVEAEIARRQSLGVAAITGYAFAYPTALSYMYSDIGLTLLGAVVARAHGSNSLDRAVRDLVTAPLDLQAHFNPSRDQIDRIAPTEYCPWRARRLHGEVHDENAAGLGGIAGHAGLFGTAEDLCRLARPYLNMDNGFIDQALVDESVACQIQAETPGDPLPNPAQSYATDNPQIRRGLSWMLPARDESCGPDWSRAGFGHTGYTGTSLWCAPEEKLAVALLTNRVYWGRDPEPVHSLRLGVHSAIARALGTR